MTRVQFYTKYTGSIEMPIPVIGDEDMVDFEDLGGTYEAVDPATMSANVSALNTYFADENAPAVQFGGARRQGQYQNKRVPSRAWFNGTIIVPADKPVCIDGGNGRLSWTGLATPTTPAMQLNSGAGSVRRWLCNFDADSDGSGILLLTPGKGTILKNIRFAAPDYNTNTCTGHGSVSLDDLVDLTTASYAYKVQDSDGVVLEDVSALHPYDHGILIQGRLQDGVIRARLWGSETGTGFKGENINGTQMDIVSESNYGYGVHVEKCGCPTIISGAAHMSADKPNVMDWWTEANNGRGNVINGSAVRQSRVRHSGGLVVGGSNSWQMNKINIDEGSRNSCVFVNDVHIDQSVQPMYDLNNEVETGPTFTLPQDTTNALNNNFSALWPNLAPTGVINGTQGSVTITLTFPANSFGDLTEDQGVQTAYWRPWGILNNFTPLVGDRYIYEINLEISTDGQAWCITNDNTSSTIVSTSIAPFGGPYGPPGLKNIGIYNPQPRAFLGRCSIGDGASLQLATPALTWSVGAVDNPQSFTMTIKSLKFYGIRETGGKVPQT